MKQNKITALQYSTLIFFLLNSFIINIGYHTLTTTSNNDSIFDVLFGGIGIIILGIIIFYIQKRNQKDIIEMIKEKIPKFLKPFICLILGIIISTVLIYHLTTLTSFIHYYILKEVSIFIITISLVATIVYIVSKGLTTISKISEVFFFIYTFIFFLGCIGVLKYMDLSNIKPLFTTSLENHFKSSIYYFVSSIIPLFLILTISPEKIEFTKKNKKFPFIFIILSIIFIFIQLITIISILGIELANIYQNPDMIIFKKISFLNILERVEVMLSLNHILNSLFFIIMCIYSIKKIIEIFVSTKKEHITLSVIGILLIIFSNVVTIKLSNYLFLSYIVLGFIFLLFIGTIIRKYIHH